MVSPTHGAVCLTFHGRPMRRTRGQAARPPLPPEHAPPLDTTMLASPNVRAARMHSPASKFRAVGRTGARTERLSTILRASQATGIVLCGSRPRRNHSPHEGSARPRRAEAKRWDLHMRAASTSSASPSSAFGLELPIGHIGKASPNPNMHIYIVGASCPEPQATPAPNEGRPLARRTTTRNTGHCSRNGRSALKTLPSPSRVALRMTIEVKLLHRVRMR